MFLLFNDLIAHNLKTNAFVFSCFMRNTTNKIVLKPKRRHLKSNIIIIVPPTTNIEEQAVAFALVTQRARVRSPVGTSFLGKGFRGFSSAVRRMSGSFRPSRSQTIFGHHYHPSPFSLQAPMT